MGKDLVKLKKKIVWRDNRHFDVATTKKVEVIFVSLFLDGLN